MTTFSESQFQHVTWKKHLLNDLISVRSVFISLRQDELYGRSATSWYSGFPRKGCKSTQKKYVKTPLVAEPEPCWSGNKNGTVIWRVFFNARALDFQNLISVYSITKCVKFETTSSDNHTEPCWSGNKNDPLVSRVFQNTRD